MDVFQSLFFLENPPKIWSCSIIHENYERVSISTESPRNGISFFKKTVGKIMCSCHLV